MGVVADIVATPVPSSSSGAPSSDTFRPRHSAYGIPSFVVDPTTGQAIEVKRVVINAASVGDNVLVAAIAGKQIVVIGLVVHSQAAVDLYFKTGGVVASSSSSVDEDAPICFHRDNPLLLDGSGSSGKLGGFKLEPNGLGHFGSATGEALVMNLSVAVGVSGCLQYVELEPLA